MSRLWLGHESVAPFLAMGLSDEELMALCDADLRDNRDSFFRFPRLFPHAELYGAGYATRFVAGWPRFLPISYFSDHGIDHCERPSSPIELTNLARTHITWSKWRAGFEMSSKRVVQIMHPLVLLRRKKRIYRRAEAAGTLVFLDHSLPSADLEPYDYEEYFESLAKLPMDLRPAGICIHMHDVNKGVHEKLRPLGIPLFTLGYSSSDKFADRFYDLVTRFQFSTSTLVGSHSYLCEEAGVRFFIWGRETELVDPLIEARREFEAHRLEAAKEIFSLIPPRRNITRDDWMQSALGLDIGFHESISRIRAVLRKDLPRALWLSARIFSKKIWRARSGSTGIKPPNVA